MRMHRGPSLEGCTAEMQPGRRPSRLAPLRNAPQSKHLRVTVIDLCSQWHWRSIVNRRHAFALSRLISPEFWFATSPSNERGRREDLVPAGTLGPLCEVTV